MALNSLIRPKQFLCLLTLVGFLVSLSSASPAPKPDIIEDWNANKEHNIKVGGDNGDTVTLSTRDIILISVAAIIVFFILVCLIGYCLCECIRSIICCICCCE